MSENHKVKLSYIAAQYRVRVELDHESCKTAAIPVELIERARKKMEAVMQEGSIVFFELYEEKFREVWEAYATATNPPPQLGFTLALGCPPLKGVRVGAPSNEKSVASLSIKAKDYELIHWKVDWLELMVNRRIKELGGTREGNSAQIFGTWLKALNGETTEEVAIGPKLSLPPAEEIQAKPYNIIANRARKEVTFIIRDVAQLSKSMDYDDIMELVKEATEKSSSQFGGVYNFLKKEIRQTVEAVYAGPQSLGFDLPVMILVASAVKRLPSSQFAVQNYQGAGKLKITISENAMEAVIAEFDRELYKDKSFELNEEWLANEARRYGIPTEASASHIKALSQLLKAQDNIDGMLIAQGRPGIPGNKPFLYETFKESKADKSDQKNLNLRALQQRSIVKVGDVVAEVRYTTQAVMGFDIFGNELDPPRSEPFNLTLGEGIQHKGRKYIATEEGIPILERNILSISKRLLHNGDVNLRSGNIIFDGPVEVSGSIDSGAIVEVKGGLVVKGSIRGAVVKCGGDLEVSLGIVTGDTGIVTCKGNVRADFIENSKIRCYGNVQVKKAILNCDVISGGDIQVTDKDNGLIAGGFLSCKESVRTASLGFKNGSITTMNVGVDWNIELAIRIRKKRIEKVELSQSNDRQALRELLSRSKQQMTEKHEQKKLDFQKKIVKAKTLLEKMTRHLDNAQALLQYNQLSKIFIQNHLHSNVDIRIGGAPVMIQRDMAGICILAKRRHGTKIVPLDVGIRLDKEERDPGGAKPSKEDKEE